jgi:hypothetical protein
MVRNKFTFFIYNSIYLFRCIFAVVDIVSVVGLISVLFLDFDGLDNSPHLVCTT